MKDLTDLRKTAEAATPGEWWTKQFEPNVCDIFAGDGAGDNPGVAEAWHPEDATHIATFDPPTVLALLNRIADLEAKLSRAKNVAGVMASRNVELTACNREAQDRLEQAEAAVARVREVCESDGYEVSNEFGTWDTVAVENIIDALDGDTRG